MVELINGKPTILVGNKVDLLQNDDHIEQTIRKNNFDVLISAKYGTNIDELKKLLIINYAMQ